MEDKLLLLGLGLVLGLVLLLPFSVRKVEEELEIFLLIMGSLAVTLSNLWSRHLIQEALSEPIKISLAVLIFGLLFRWCRDKIRNGISRLADKLGLGFFLFVLVSGLGFASSIITAIIAALVLVEIISGLKIEKDKERAIVILSCFSIGLGAVLTPLGEPLSTIATSKLAGPPHHADFFFLGRLLWPWVTLGILLLALLAARYAGQKVSSNISLTEDEPESIQTILIRAGKVYCFVIALVLLGHGFTPIVDRYLIETPQTVLYWINMISAILDNATLAAAEISPKMSLAKIEFLLIGLLVSGGMLIPGNIPNIICAGKLNIKSRDWAKFAVPVGLILMLLYFILLKCVSH
ncbi:MAG: DUF1646 family protein [Elusimicrobia bacterium]|nr:DUF1646 family protein [Elusimicrobiota bacterium]